MDSHPTQAFAPLRFDPLWRVIGWGLIAAVVWLSLTPTPLEVPVEQGDKLGHLAGYALLMFWFAQIDRMPAQRLRWAIGLIALGIGLEFAQSFTAVRAFELLDMLADAAGVLLGWLIAPPRGVNVLLRVEQVLGSSH